HFSVDCSLPTFLPSRLLLERRPEQRRVDVAVEQFRANLEQLGPKLVLAQSERVFVFDLEMLRNQVGHQCAVFRRRFSRHAIERGRPMRLPRRIDASMNFSASLLRLPFGRPGPPIFPIKKRPPSSLRCSVSSMGFLAIVASSVRPAPIESSCVVPAGHLRPAQRNMAGTSCRLCSKTECRSIEFPQPLPRALS